MPGAVGPTRLVRSPAVSLGTSRVGVAFEHRRRGAQQLGRGRQIVVRLSEAQVAQIYSEVGKQRTHIQSSAVPREQAPNGESVPERMPRRSAAALILRNADGASDLFEIVLRDWIQ